MGVRREGSAIGNMRKTIADSGLYEGFCWEFLQAQVLLQRPLGIAVMGRANRGYLKIAGRLGVDQGDPFHHTFTHEGKSHTALVTY